jgi:S1-C subfamily serine protease
MAPPPQRPAPQREVTLSRGTQMAAVVVVTALVAVAVSAVATLGWLQVADRSPVESSAAAAPARTGEVLTADGVDVVGVLSTVRSSIVGVNVTTPQGEGTGTGIVIDDQGHIITNSHVVADGEASEVSVAFADGQELPARVIGAVPADDLALLAVDAVPDGVTPAVLADSDAAQVGEPVVAIGNALDLGADPSVTVGIISAKDRTIAGEGAPPLAGLIQTDAAINPGNSGGPLVNARGEVVGVNTAIVAGAQSVGFAIPAARVELLLSDLLSGGATNNPDGGYLGVSSVDVTWLDPDEAAEQGLEGVTGAVVTEVEPSSPAAEAGITAGDVILSLDGDAVDSPATLGRLVRTAGADSTVEIVVLRDGSETPLSVTLTRR